ncbi:hypothetical protein OIU78_010875 [Salix suchowensis]|nr:hypothetical protein OIU78_010875 [Salix suchowensis]
MYIILWSSLLCHEAREMGGISQCSEIVTYKSGRFVIEYIQLPIYFYLKIF